MTNMIDLILHENSKLGHLQKCIQDHKNKQQNQNLDSLKNIFEVCAFSLYYKMLSSAIVQKSIMFSYCCDWEEECLCYQSQVQSCYRTKLG